MVEFSVQTTRQIQFVEITNYVQQLVSTQQWHDGICHLFCPHTTAGLCINENADPTVCDDLEQAYQRLVPAIRYQHLEGNSPAHLLSTLLGSSLFVFVEKGRLQLGRWQGIFFVELDGPRHRQVWLKWVAR